MRGLVALLWLAVSAGPVFSDECLPATYVTPCGTSAWQLGDGNRQKMALVRGIGSPTLLSEEVLVAHNQFFICGKFAAQPVDDAECGAMSLFVATSFSVKEPLRRRSCSLDECRSLDGPARLTSDDLDGPGTLQCGPHSAQCTIAAL